MRMNMKLKETFLKTKIGGKTFVLPYGQGVADHVAGISLNETGEILWEGLEKGLGKKELLCLLKKEFAIENASEEELNNDIINFQEYLKTVGIAETKVPEDYGWNPLTFSAGPLHIIYKGPQMLFDKYFSQFGSRQKQNANLTIQISCLPPRFLKNGTVLIRTEELILIDAKSDYLFLFPKFPVLQEMHVKKNGSQAILFCDNSLLEQQMEDIFHGIRFAVLIAASEKGLFFLHSASLLYQGKAWLFSGKSGTGKSTHTNLWKELFQTTLLNGDLNMIGIQNNSAYVYGQPWCGTSGICTPENYPLGGITFLKQAKQNICTMPETPEKILAIIQRLISPAWDGNLMERNISFAEQLEKHCPVWQLFCTPDREAAIIMKKEIDKHIKTC